MLIAMTQPRAMLHFREATIDDAWLVADLDTAIQPEDARDGEMLAFWWTHQFSGEVARRWISVDNGIARAFIFAGHSPWREGEPRYGQTRVRLHPDEWNEQSYVDMLERAEAWLRDEGAKTSVAHIREDFAGELALLARLGFREERRDRSWQLDLVRGHERLLATAEETRAAMKKQGVQLLTYDADGDPEKARKVYELDLEGSEDVPKTVPWPVPSFDEWWTVWFEHPAHRPDRMWLAREGDDVVGLSFIGYPPRRGTPFTAFTCTARRVRGRGIARALKYETVAQAIALGVKKIETRNDSTNAPILHLNEEMGYEPAPEVIELHREIPNG